MKAAKYVSLLLIAVFFIMGCSGPKGKLKTQSESDSKVTQQELIDNWSDYHIRFRSAAIVFDPKNDDRKILLGGKRGWHWITVKDQETWTEFVKANTTSDGEFRTLIGSDGDFRTVDTGYSMTGVREIWGPDNQLYGYIIHSRNGRVVVRLVDDNKLRLWNGGGIFGGGK